MNSEEKNKTFKKKNGFRLRKFLNFKAKLSDLTDFIGCNPKGVHYIEDNFYVSKPTRYFMYLRKHNVDLNKVFDELLEHEKDTQ